MTNPRFCPVCDGQPRIGVAIGHPAMRALVSELIGQDLGRAVEDPRRCGDGGALDLVVIDSVAFGDWYPSESPAGSRTKVIVVGPEPDPSYRDFALARGADAWVVRDRIAEELRGASRRVLGCIHVPAFDDYPEFLTRG